MFFDFLQSASVEELLEQAVLDFADFHDALALGGGTRSRAACALWAERKFRRKFSACARTICWPPYFPKRWRARKISKAKSTFPIIL